MKRRFHLYHILPLINFFVNKYKAKSATRTKMNKRFCAIYNNSTFYILIILTFFLNFLTILTFYFSPRAKKIPLLTTRVFNERSPTPVMPSERAACIHFHSCIKLTAFVIPSERDACARCHNRIKSVAFIII